MRKSLVALLFLTLTGAAFTSQAAEEAKPFVTSKEVDLSKYLPAPPADDSAQTKAEIKELLAIQASRTPEQEKAAIADAQENVWRFADVMGPEFTAEKLPKVAALFDRIVATEDVVDGSAKKFFNRSRPYMVDEQIHPLLKKSKSGSWPSGHSTVGYLMATVLADMVPEKRNELFTRAAGYAENRLVAGFHYRSDTVMSRTGAALIAQKMAEQPEFQTEFDAAKTELRASMGLK
ncbi:MAG: phosphatase PAP2 family protein [Ewingella americana]|uniref:acid phosphatase n=1 Tax=Ewingella americana TaxID=41202 RepID=UPI00242F2B3F|nr:phosphatase PAP2 family protein [Ewingella americana]MCI1679578.1 phosphatase PAP2 family protein [Ewingella americana]MCI1854905.1 phosphatase PAP2 family protein [Ewingella americana]MCI1861812.1 phosphatase PAP2 family protein [Ewingella americana]MCI2141713.1 phosphatase PAP2 family protein [Ewingella americana]MCI2164367.1 phosphatase PAP2 family protein [Ewingella americana]